MANQEHINWLLEGAEAWNERIQQEGMGFKPDLSGVNVWEMFLGDVQECWSDRTSRETRSQQLHVPVREFPRRKYWFNDT